MIQYRYKKYKTHTEGGFILDYIKHPTTSKMLIQELKRACDDYLGRRLDEGDLKNLIQGWARNYGDLMFEGQNGFKSSVNQRLGAKRIDLVNRMLEGYQNGFL